MIHRVVILTAVTLSIVLYAGDIEMKTYDMKYGEIGTNHELTNDLKDHMLMTLHPNGVHIEFKHDNSPWNLNGIPAGTKKYADDCEENVFEDWPTEGQNYQVGTTQCTSVALDSCPLVLGCRVFVNQNDPDSCVVQDDTYCTNQQTKAECEDQQHNLQASRPCEWDGTECKTGKVFADKGDDVACARPDHILGSYISGGVWLFMLLLAFLFKLFEGTNRVEPGNVDWKDCWKHKYFWVGVLPNFLAFAGHVTFLVFTVFLFASFDEEEVLGTSTFAAVRAGHSSKITNDVISTLQVTSEVKAGTYLLIAVWTLTSVSAVLTMITIAARLGSEKGFIAIASEPLYARMMKFV